MKALILANGELYKPGVVRKRVSEDRFDLILAADGGAQQAFALGVVPDTIVGDMDSILDLEQQGHDKVESVPYPSEKDETDLELALLYAREKGAGHIVVVGAMGGRMDMTVSNLLLLAHPGLASCRIEVWHGEQTGWLIGPPGEEVTGLPGDTISLIPLAGPVSGVTTDGLKYALRNKELAFAPSLGISNLMEKPVARISLSSGLLLVVHTPGRA